MLSEARTTVPEPVGTVTNCDAQELRADEFYLDSHRRIYACISRLMNRGSAADITTVPEEFRAHFSQANRWATLTRTRRITGAICGTVLR